VKEVIKIGFYVWLGVQMESLLLQEEWTMLFVYGKMVSCMEG
jgi:hypothetical protein